MKRFKPSTFLLALALLAPGALPLRANTITDNITITGGTVVEEGDNAALVTFTNVDKDGTISFDAGTVQAKLLAVGGGGGGGRVNSTTGAAGGGGGGGGGGFVETSLTLKGGAYTIHVGKGGAAVTDDSTFEYNAARGGSGDDTTLVKAGESKPLITAKGGGGGGAGGKNASSKTGSGLDGGSGGGGSGIYKTTSTVTPKDGGASIQEAPGVGNPGGKGTGLNVAAGGGGAGGKAGDASTAATAGGIGKQSELTGEWYAAGGAGGDRRNSKGSGKIEGQEKGGGGSGGSGDNTDPRDGVDGTGGGGGGGTAKIASGKGGSGIFVIRLSNYMAGGVVPPSVPDFTYDGTEKVAASDTAYYTVSGNKATNAGSYTLVVTLTAAGKELGWDDPTIVGDTVNIPWTIKSCTVKKPVAKTGLVYQKGVEQTAYDQTEKELTQFTLANHKATDAGNYTFTATLNNPAGLHNYVWEGGGEAALTIPWTIEKLKIDPPVKTSEKFTFTGEEQTGFVENVELYTLNDQNRQIHGATYTVTATLADAANTKWSDDAAAERTDLSWTIGPKDVEKPGAVTGLVFTGLEQTGVVARAGFTLAGEKATDAGNYTATATLDNAAGKDYKWKNGDANPLTVGWSIAVKTVAPPPAEATYTYDGKPHEPVLESEWYARSGDVGARTAAGSYRTTATLNFNREDQVNVIWSDGTAGRQELEWTIKPADNVISNLHLDDWQTGDLSVRYPNCETKFGTAVSYAWSASPTGPDWTPWNNATRPTESGTYYLRANAPKTDDWYAASAVTNFCVWTNPEEVFTDFVDITLAGLPTTKEAAVAISFREPVKENGVVTAGLPGFEYGRTGERASELRFVLRDDTARVKDQLLPFKTKPWNPAGESTVWVQLPRIVEGSTTIRMYWHTKDGEAKSEAHPELVKEETLASGVTAAFSLVNKEGLTVNYWTAAPSIDKPEWEVTDPPTEENVHLGKLKTGDVKPYYLAMPVGTTNETIQTAPGTYEIVFTMAKPNDGYTIYDGEKRVKYEMIWHNTYENLGGTLGGRILLGNNDTKPGNEITGQAYWQTDPMYGTYWAHEGESLVGGPFPYLGDGTYHTLYQAGEPRQVLWRLRDIRLGSFYPRNGSPIATRLYLPWSETAQPRTAEDAPMSSTEVTYLIFRNKGGYQYKDAPAIYSPCYTNGIGTIYFDAVNGFYDDEGAYLIVEVATETSKGETPTDEHCLKETEDDPFYYLTHDTNDTELAESAAFWKPIKPIVLVKRKGSDQFVEDTTQKFENNYIHLQLKTDQSTEAFYRILAPTNFYGPARFRIRRPVKSGDTAGVDTSNLILVDNVIVSPPRMGANVEAAGKSDEASGRTGKQTLGQAGAFSRAFPAKTDTDVLGRAKIKYTTVAGLEGEIDKSKFLASARLHYRWRYLYQRFGDWQTVYLDHTRLEGLDGEMLPTVSPLDFGGRMCDVEWFYDLTVQAPAYAYVDYSGCGVEKPVADFVEAQRAVTNRLDTTVRQASGGTDWFVRLREGRSDWEGMEVEIAAVDKTAQPLAGVYRMELVEDNMWRALVPIPTNAEGRCTFNFAGVNLHPDGDPDVIEIERLVLGAAEEGASCEIPSSGTLPEGGFNGIAFTIDHAAGYLEFRMSDRFRTWQVGRAEYQDFNSWSDAHTEGKFRADANDTNSVNVAEMTYRETDFAKWDIFVPTDDEWNESFRLADYAPTPGSRWDKEILHASHETPAGWNAQNITFVSERFVSRDEVTQKENSGMAGKLLGGGQGKMDFSGSTNALSRTWPQGLETVKLSGRLGQSLTFDAASYSKAAYNNDNYMFFVPVTMSHFTDNKAENPTDMAVGASVSLIGYYDTGSGCYEFRATRLTKGEKNNDPWIRLAIYKWYVENYQWTSKLLAYKDFNCSKANDNVGALWSNEKDNTGNVALDKDRKYFGMFISLSTEYTSEDRFEVKKTSLICGLSDAHKIDVNKLSEPWANFGNATGAREAANYIGLTYDDETNPFGWGSYGVMAKDCPAQFVMPAHKDGPFGGAITGESGAEVGGKFFPAQPLKLLQEDETGAPTESFIDDRRDLYNRRAWSLKAGRCECFTNEQISIASSWIGLRTPPNLVQEVELYLKPKGRGETFWKKYGAAEVKGYGFKQLDFFTLRIPGEWDLRLQTGPSSVDVVVDDVTQSQWQAPDVEISSSTDFFYTQGIVVTNKTTQEQTLRLQPARALPSRPVSLRSPILNGLGKFSFTYRNADANAEIWVQVATNRVNGNLSGTGGYNESIKSVELGEQQDIGEWITVKRYSAKAADADLRLQVNAGEDSKSLYLGWHNHADRPIQGVFRLFVPTNVVIAATNAAAHAAADSDVPYGQVTLTKASCTDEPGISDRSWRGWNMRTIGDSTDTEKRMNLVDMVIEGGGQGLTAALNNSTDNVEDNKGKPVDPKDLKLNSGYPAIYSPTMHSAKGGIGTVTVKARLYSTNDVPETTGGGRFVIYGAKDSRAEKWDTLATNIVTSSVFTDFTWTAGHDVYTAIKIELTEPWKESNPKEGEYDRIIFDEIVIGERVPPTINFVYARPFRMNLFSEEPIADILSPAEQPLAGESWGVQTKLTLQQLTDEIDVEKGFEVYLSYFRGEEPWGYGNWCSNRNAVVNIPLRQVGEATNLVFRSVGDRPESLVSPAAARGEIVQFMLTVKYWNRGGKDDTMTMPVDWEQPDWFYPLEKNLEHGALNDDRNFSAYTVLDSVSPGRAWINEVSWNDGPADQNGGKIAPTENQFMEICVPAGVDLTDWEVWITESGNHDRQLFARLGDTFRKIPGSKPPTANCTNGYEFLVLKAPNATVAEADASWYAVNLGTVVRGGTLSYGDPYQFELVRPSGVIEHQFVLDGTNELSRYSWGHVYDGTNFVQELAGDDPYVFPGVVSPKRFYAGHELARRAGDKLCSVGVVGGKDGPDTANWPGGSNTWAEAMAFTPGRLNAGQVIPEGWFIAPNGTNSWVYFSVEDRHIRQNLGGDTNQTVLVVIPQGQTTNVHYTVDGWYEGSVLENGTRTASGRVGAFDWPVSPTGSMYYVRASAVPQAKLAETFGLTKENPYTPAVLRWLEKWNKDGTLTADDIRLARFMGLHSFGDSWSFMDLTDMYWLDIPPVPVTPEEWAHNDGTNWWFRGGIDSFSGENHIIHRKEYRGGVLKDVAYTNKQITVTLYATNEVTHEAWSPAKLQGLNNESSAGDYGTSWTSVTFKVKGRLDLSEKSPYLPFRTFIFGEGSFDENHQAVIDILDPFQSPIGRAYDWDQHPNTSAYFQWRIDTKYYPYSIEMLKADSTYKDEE